VNWAAHYPAIESEQRQVKIVDVGMGFGGLTIALAALFPDKLVLGTVVARAYCGCALLRHGGFSAKRAHHSSFAYKDVNPPIMYTSGAGMEIRAKVCEYVRLRIEAMRKENESTNGYQNAACLR
jgi:hypothetical protein